MQMAVTLSTTRLIDKEMKQFFYFSLLISFIFVIAAEEFSFMYVNPSRSHRRRLYQYFSLRYMY